MTPNSHDIIRDFSRFAKEGDPFAINFVGKSICDERFYIERDVSPIMSFEYIVEGEGVLEINGQTLYPRKGDVFLLTEGSNHRYYTQKNNSWKKYFVSFRGPMAYRMKELYLPYNKFLFSGCDVKKHFENIFQNAFDDNKTYDDLVYCITLEILKIMMCLHSNTENENEDLADRIKNIINYSIEGDLSLDDISQKLNYSKNHIINVFKEKYNKTPYQYYMDEKIETAKRYLQETTCSIGDIAVNLSFSDTQYFSSCFKKSTGVSPKEFRKKTRL